MLAAIDKWVKYGIFGQSLWNKVEKWKSDVKKCQKRQTIVKYGKYGRFQLN